MNEPLRLRDGDGPARRLMAGSVLHVPSASRRRAVAFTSAAATLSASTVAVAATTSVLKSFVLCVALGAVGGGVVSLAASETVALLETKSVGPLQPAPLPAEARAASASLPAAAAAVAAEPPTEVAVAPVAEPATKEAGGKSKSFGRDDSAEPRVAVPVPARPSLGSSLFEEQRIIESARAAVARGDTSTAFSLLDNYERAYPNKQFWPEALALRIEALRSSGQLATARALAADFAQRYPHHPLLPRIQASVAK